jgi:CheY-like chemotaxis protein
MATTSIPRTALVCIVALATIGASPASAADQSPRPDPLAQSVLESLAFPPRTTPPALLDAAIRAADVEAYDVAARYFTKLADTLEKAGDKRIELLADLGDTADPASLRRLERVLGDRDEDIRPIVQAMREAARERRRDPARLTRNADDLSSDKLATRTAAFDQLARAGVDALPVLVDLLQSEEPAQERARTFARELVRGMGAEARQPLLAWLGSDDVEHWPGIIESLGAATTADDAADVAEHLLAPALVPDAPPAARDRANRVLKQLAARGMLPAEAMADDTVPPAPGTAIALLTRRLDRVLSIDGLPAPDHLLMEPVLDPVTASAAAGKTVERFVWNPEARRLERVNLPPQVARTQEAIHLARDLAALNATEPDAVRLVLLARLESLLAAAGDPLTALDRVPTEQLQAAITGPEGFDYEAAADVLEIAASRGMFTAAAGVARAIAAANAAAAAQVAGDTATGDSAPEEQAAAKDAAALTPAVRASLLRALAVPDAALQFEAARTLAQAAGDPPYRGSSRVVETLLQAATSTGEEIAVVAHIDPVVREELATGLSRFGYRVEKVASGRDAILAARASVDTVLVVIAARTVRPTALETVQFIQRQAVGDVPPVLVVVDPLDDDARGKFLTQLLLKFSDLDCVGIMDRLDSLFIPRLDLATGKPIGPPRFPDHLAQVAGPQAVAPEARQARATQRRTRASQALALLADLGRRGWDVAAAETTARMALMRSPQPGRPTDLFSPAAALLGTIGSSRAQQALLGATERPELPAESRKQALAGFAESVNRYGVLLECHPLQAAYARYNQSSVSADRAVAGAVLDVIETPSRKARPVSADAAHPRPTR